MLFLLSQVAAVPDLFLTAVKLTHDKTGAQYLHAARDDSNNLFRLVLVCYSHVWQQIFTFCLQSHFATAGLWSMFVFYKSRTSKPSNPSFLSFSVQFRTTPMDSTGVPHILEHTVLCGSEKYPCRDPFFKMLNRSLSTFMNAFTGTGQTEVCHTMLVTTISV